MQLYKYLHKQHLQQFQNCGRIAIGNIELYRAIEHKALCDEFEGRTVYSIYTNDEAVELSVEQVNAITNDYHFTAKLRIEPHSFFRDSLKVPNAFTFSLSSKFDTKLMTRFNYDAFYTIVNINNFTKAIYDELNKRYKLLFCVAEIVHYVQTKTFNITNANKDTIIRTTPYDSGKSDRVKTIYIEDYFTKADQFQHESEFRLVFVPVGSISKNLIFLDCKQLLEFCKF